MRLANVIAKADGQVTEEEIRHLRWIQAEMRRVLEPMPVPDDEEEEAPPRPGSVAVQEALPELPASAAPVPREEGLLPLDAPDPVALEKSLQETIAELDELVGLDAIKQEVRSLINYLKMQKAREQFGLPQTPLSLHAVFSGNPGTGKTSVARLLGKIFGALGILSRGHLIETDRSGLVAEYAGQTAPKAHKKIDEALDGVLFIDEAYSLVAETGEDPYGAEALQVLLKRMEDNRHRLVVILAGYPRPMEQLLRRNPGLSSRFNRHFVFPDYSAAELGRIFNLLRAKDHYELPILSRVKLLLGFQYLLAHRDEHFGNGRLVRNVYEQAISRLADRISGVASLTRALLTTLQPEDILMEGVPPAVWSELDSETRTFRMSCPGCRQSSRFPQRFLGHKATCKRCGRNFAVDWGEVE
jgi:SpoVK/Ycf46/Vps4 family AAA+-type ATPase